MTGDGNQNALYIGEYLTKWIEKYIFQTPQLITMAKPYDITVLQSTTLVSVEGIQMEPIRLRKNLFKDIGLNVLSLTEFKEIDKSKTGCAIAYNKQTGINEYHYS